MMKKVHIVFCMDTEGPCDDPNNSDLLKNWKAVDKAMDKLFSNKFRNYKPDYLGNNFKIGWFFLTWTGFKTNPRGRDFGYHKVRDHYIKRWGEKINNYGDEHCWHYHLPDKTGIGNKWGLNWFDSDEHIKIISRQIMEREWFPISYRAGGTFHSNESSLWIDQWFPIDYSNRAPLNYPGLVDWSSGFHFWDVYKPDCFDFTKDGNGRRYMARTLDLKTNVFEINEAEVEKAFNHANDFGQAILSVFDHDYRDIEDRILNFIDLVKKVSLKYENVEFVYSTPREAIVTSQKIEKHPKSLQIEAAVYNNKLRIWTTSPIFQNVPWIAVQDKEDNFFQITKNIKKESPLTYSVDLEEINFKKIGVAASTINGLSDVFIVKKSEEVFSDFYKYKIKPHPIYPSSINEHSKLYPSLLVRRLLGIIPEMDSIKQTIEIIKRFKLINFTILDVNCKSQLLFNSLKNTDLSFKYFGIDPYQRSVELGKLINNDLYSNRVSNIHLNSIDDNESYDITTDLFDFRFIDLYEKYFEKICKITNKYIIIRTANFGTEFKKTFVPDLLLEKEYRHLKTYVNTFNKIEFEKFMLNMGFKCEWIKDKRLQKLDKDYEDVGGIKFKYEFLLATRIKRVNYNKLNNKWSSKNKKISNPIEHHSGK